VRDVNDVGVVKVKRYVRICRRRRDMNRLKETRERKGISQYELGRLIGRYQSLIWQIEHGYHEPDEAEKEEIAKVLGMDVNEIFPEYASKTL